MESGTERLLADGCQDRLSTGNYVWKAAINLRATPAPRGRMKDSPVRTDGVSVVRAREQLIRAGWRDGDIEVITVTGLFRVPGLELERLADGSTYGPGVDGQGTPAYMIFDSVRDPEILRCVRISADRP